MTACPHEHNNDLAKHSEIITTASPANVALGKTNSSITSGGGARHTRDKTKVSTVML